MADWLVVENDVGKPKQITGNPYGINASEMFGLPSEELIRPFLKQSSGTSGISVEDVQILFSVIPDWLIWEISRGAKWSFDEEKSFGSFRERFGSPISFFSFHSISAHSGRLPRNKFILRTSFRDRYLKLTTVVSEGECLWWKDKVKLSLQIPISLIKFGPRNKSNRSGEQTRSDISPLRQHYAFI